MDNLLSGYLEASLLSSTTEIFLTVGVRAGQTDNKIRFQSGPDW